MLGLAGICFTGEDGETLRAICNACPRDEDGKPRLFQWTRPSKGEWREVQRKKIQREPSAPVSNPST